MSFTISAASYKLTDTGNTQHWIKNWNQPHFACPMAIYTLYVNLGMQLSVLCLRTGVAYKWVVWNLYTKATSHKCLIIVASVDHFLRKHIKRIHTNVEDIDVANSLTPRKLATPTHLITMIFPTKTQVINSFDGHRFTCLMYEINR
jgi:hypothetical protein